MTVDEFYLRVLYIAALNKLGILSKDPLIGLNFRENMPTSAMYFNDTFKLSSELTDNTDINLPTLKINYISLHIMIRYLNLFSYFDCFF